MPLSFSLPTTHVSGSVFWDFNVFLNPVAPDGNFSSWKIFSFVDAGKLCDLDLSVVAGSSFFSDKLKLLASLIVPSLS